MVVVLFLLAVSLLSSAYAAGSVAGDYTVLVEDDGMVVYSVDANSVKWRTGLSGHSLLDVSIVGRLDDGARRFAQLVLAGNPPGVEYSQVAAIRTRYLFKSDEPGGRIFKAAVIGKEYVDLYGVSVWRQSFAAPERLSAWRELNETEDKVLQAVLATPKVQAAQGIAWDWWNEPALKFLDEGFIGTPWGTQPSAVSGARYVAAIAPRVAVYIADLDLSPVLGPVVDRSTPRLIYTEDEGLVQGRINFCPRDYAAAYRHLVGILGEPSPIIYERRPASVDFLERAEWFVGFDTKVVLSAGFTTATLEIGKRNAISLEGVKLEEIIALAQFRQAQEYERQEKFPAAVGLYQEILWAADCPHPFATVAQERLVTLSQRQEVLEVLGQYRGYAFSRLVNGLTDETDQLWLRIDLAPEAQRELQQERPDDFRAETGLGNITAVLCHVRFGNDADRVRIVEQLWLDSANRIVGTRPGAASQNGHWPAPHIQQVCKDFLARWFTSGKVTGEGITTD